MSTNKTKKSKTKKTASSKYETCKASVKWFKFAKGVSLRSVVHNGKQMLFWSDIDEKLAELNLGKYLTAAKIKINVKKEQPGVRYLVDVNDFNVAYSKYATQAAKDLFAPIKKTPEPIEQFNFSFIDMEEPEKVSAPPVEIAQAEPEQPTAQEKKLDLASIKPFSKDIISAGEANSDKFSILDEQKHTKPAPVKAVSGDEYDRRQEAIRRGIIASVANYIAKRCPDMRDDSSEYKNVRLKTWDALIQRFNGLIGPYIQEKYNKTLNDVTLALDVSRMLNPENYLLRLMDFDKSNNDQLLKMLQDTSDACFDICRSGK